LTRTIGVPGFRDGAGSRRALPGCTELAVDGGPRVRIRLPPARSQQRTLWLPGASHAGGTQSSNPLCCKLSVPFASSLSKCERLMPLIADQPNLLVVQTMSKSRALAGLRVGYGFGGVGLIEALRRVKDSFNSLPARSRYQVSRYPARRRGRTKNTHVEGRPGQMTNLKRAQLLRRRVDRLGLSIRIFGRSGQRPETGDERSSARTPVDPDPSAV
jgi:hypothetical protein